MGTGTTNGARGGGVRASRVMTRRVAALMLLAGLGVGGVAVRSASACPPVEPVTQTDGKTVDPSPQRAPVIRVALLLDTSNSMDGLIAQAKSQLWSVVSTMRSRTFRGRAGTLQIALYEYGNNRLDASGGYIRKVSGFTSDLDLLSEQLFGLSTSGGEEFCGAVMQRALAELHWERCPGDLSMIVIAGNEPFTQGEIHYSEAIAEAVRKGVRVHTVFCGTREEGVATRWQDGAVLGRGSFTNITQGSDVGFVASPFDDRISQLGTQINETYLPFGARGAEGAARQAAADAAPASLPASAREEARVARAGAKGTGMYQNAHWDLVDALDQNTVELESLAEEELPEVVRAVPADQRGRVVQDYRGRRTALRQELADLTAQREQFVRQQRSQQAGTRENTLGDALHAALETYAREEGWEAAPAR